VLAYPGYGEVAVISAGPYANYLHLAPDREPHQYLTTQFLQAGISSCRPTNSIKALLVMESGHKRKWKAGIKGMQCPPSGFIHRPRNQLMIGQYFEFAHCCNTGHGNLT